MNKKSFFCIGFVSKKIGFRGKISVKISTGNPKNYLEIDFIYINIDNQLIPYKVNSSITKKNIFLEIKLEDIDNETEVNSLLKKEVFIKKNKYQKGDEFHNHELINYRVFNLNKNIGLIKELIHQKSQKLIVVNDEKKQEILIPFVEEFIKEIDSENKILKLKLPAGLLDLNFKI